MMEPKFHSTKDKILELLKKTGFMSVNDLTEQLNITHMAIRKHLSQLEKDGPHSIERIEAAYGPTSSTLLFNR